MNGIEALSANPAVQATARALVHFLWQGTLVGLATGWALTLLERNRAAVRYGVALGGLLVMAILPFATALRLVETAGEGSVWSAYEEDGIAPAPASAAPGALAAVSPKPVPARPFSEAALPWLVGAWLAGVALLSLYNLGGWRWARRLSRQGEPAGEAVAALARDLRRRLGIDRAVALLESSAVSVPMVVGWLRPVILVPASTLTGLTPRQLEAILAHELAHVRRHDYLVNLFQTAVETLLFYHPAVWWVSNQVRRERESCCDDLAVAVCGDRLGYARALVDLEELRAATPRLALAASGGSLGDRVRRLVGAPGRPSRRPWAAGLLALTLLPAGAAVQLACSRSHEAKAPVVTENGLPGTWKAEIQGDKVRIEMTYSKLSWGRWVSVDDYPVSQLAGFAPGPDSRFELRRAAGTFHFQGSFQGRRGRGACGFKPNPAFEKALGQHLPADRAMELAVSDITPSYLREMKELGLLEPRHARFPKSFFGEIHQIAYNAFVPKREDPLRRLMDLKVQNITPEYARGIKNAGYPGIQAWQLVDLRIHGIEPAYVQGLRDSGYRHLDPGEVVQFQIQGVTPEWLRGIVESGIGDLRPDEIIQLRMQGIDGDWLHGVVQAGPAKLRTEQLIALHLHGVDGDFIRKAREHGHGNPSAEKLVELRIKGI